MGLTQSSSWEDSPWSGNTLSGKEKLQDAAVGEMDMLIIFWGMKGSIPIEKRTTINCGSDLQLFRQNSP